MLALCAAAAAATDPHERETAGHARFSDRPHWPALPLFCIDNYEDVAHTPDCDLLTAPAPVRTHWTQNAQDTHTPCPRCLEPLWLDLTADPAYPELAAAQDALLTQNAFEFWQDQLTHYDRLDLTRPVTAIDILSHLAWAFTTYRQAGEQREQLPARARIDLETPHRSVTTFWEQFRAVATDEVLLTQAAQLLTAEQDLIDASCWLFCDMSSLDDSRPAMLEMLWPGSVVYGPGRSSYAAHIPAVFAAAWWSSAVAQLPASEIVTATRARPPHPRGGTASLTPARLHVRDIAHITTEHAAAALRLWEPAPADQPATAMNAAVALDASVAVLDTPTAGNHPIPRREPVTGPIRITT